MEQPKVNIYNNSFVYAIRSRQTDLFYIGSTADTLCRRIAKHRDAYRGYAKDMMTHNWCSSFTIMELGDAYIELLEAVNCDTRLELKRREGQLQRENTLCCNDNIAGRTATEYYNDNKERLAKYYADNSERFAKYYADNRDVKLAYQASYSARNAEAISIKNKARYAKLKEARRLALVNTVVVEPVPLTNYNIKALMLLSASRLPHL